jgi:hypothetical protein
MSTARRLRAQAEGRHYSTFSLYTPEELRASIATFLARLPSPGVSWVDEHLLVVAGASLRKQMEPDVPGSRAIKAGKDQAPRSAPDSPGRLSGGVLAAAYSPTACACERASITSSASPAEPERHLARPRTWGSKLTA